MGRARTCFAGINVFARPFVWSVPCWARARGSIALEGVGALAVPAVLGIVERGWQICTFCMAGFARVVEASIDCFAFTSRASSEARLANAISAVTVVAVAV